MNRSFIVLGDDIEFHYVIHEGDNQYQKELLVKNGDAITVSDFSDSFSYSF